MGRGGSGIRTHTSGCRAEPLPLQAPAQALGFHTFKAGMTERAARGNVRSWGKHSKGNRG